MLFKSLILFSVCLAGCGSFYMNANIGWGDGQKIETSTKLSQKGEQGRGLIAPTDQSWDLEPVQPKPKLSPSSVSFWDEYYNN